MNLSSFREHLKARDARLDTLFSEIGHLVESGSYDDVNALWSNPELGHCQPSPKHCALVIFPEQVHLLPISVFYDRLYIELNDWDPKMFKKIDNEEAFKHRYQISPSDLLALIRSLRVVPILKLEMHGYSDYFLQHVILPILTEELPHLTFAGRSLICQVWQVKNNAFPDPQTQEWGFLMDLCGAMGIGATLVRPEIKSDIWSRKELIFDSLKIKDLAGRFISQDFTLDEFFTATQISFNSRIPITKYLAIFDKVDKDKIYSLYSNLNKQAAFDELGLLNRRLKEALEVVDEEQVCLKVLSAPFGLLFYLATVSLRTILADEMIEALKTLAEDKAKNLLLGFRHKFEDVFLKNWEKHIGWLNTRTFPEVLELARLRKLLEQGQVK